MTPLMPFDRCPNCRDNNRPALPLTPFATELTSDGFLAHYQCPRVVCLHGWFTTWHPDVVGDLRPLPGERAA